MIAARLMRMGLSEIAGRGVQEMRKRLERGRPPGCDDSSRALSRVLAPGPDLGEARARARAGDVAGAGRLLLARLADGGPGRFFPGAASAEVPAVIAARMGGATAALCEAAEAIVAGRFDLLGYRDLDFGDPIDWHLDPVSGRRAPLAHWTAVDFLDAERVGDSKVTWELNRHQWLVRLGQAYRLTGDERYARRFAGALSDWIGANPPGLGINWASSLEAAFRIVAWSWGLMLFRGSPAVGPALYADVLVSVSAQATRIERYLSRYFSPNTHLTGEALGLVYAGLVFPELRGARRWERLGRQILLEELDRQVLPDGMHFERATCYHRYTAEIYLHFLLLELRGGAALPRAVAERLEAMVDVLLALRRPDGFLPEIGDDDGGELLPLAPRERGDLRGLFATAAALFGRDDYAWAAGGLAPEALWLLGTDALEAAERVGARPPAAPDSTLLPDAGYVVMRSAWDAGAHQLVFDAGALGCPVSAGHGHADLLAVQCAAWGQAAIVDPGTYCYTAEAAWREHFRSTAAHSTVRVDGRDQAQPRGPFAWHARPAARLRRFTTSAALDVADGVHDAYADGADPIVHRRRVLWVKPFYWIVVDDLAGGDVHDVELRFQLAPAAVEVDGALWTRVRLVGGGELALRPVSTAALTAEVLCGVAAPRAGWVSPGYGRREPAPALVYRGRARLPVRVATLIWPAEAGAALPVVRPIEDALGHLIGLDLFGGEETVRFDEPETVGRTGARLAAVRARG